MTARSKYLSMLETPRGGQSVKTTKCLLVIVCVEVLGLAVGLRECCSDQ
jgi:hypothetical protein